MRFKQTDSPAGTVFEFEIRQLSSEAEDGSIRLTGDVFDHKTFNVLPDRKTRRWRRLAAPVVVSIRLDGYGLAAMARRAMISAGKAARDGCVTVRLVSKPEWREIAPSDTVCGHDGCELAPGHIPGHTDR